MATPSGYILDLKWTNGIPLQHHLSRYSVLFHLLLQQHTLHSSHWLFQSVEESHHHLHLFVFLLQKEQEEKLHCHYDLDKRYKMYKEYPGQVSSFDYVDNQNTNQGNSDPYPHTFLVSS